MFNRGKARIIVRDACSRDLEDVASSLLAKRGLAARLASIIALIITGILLLLALVLDIPSLTALVGILGASLWALDLVVEKRRREGEKPSPPYLFVERIRVYIEALCSSCQMRPPGSSCRVEDNMVVIEYVRPLG